MIVQCEFDPPHTHEYPDDWIFGGPRETDPRADPRFRPTTYEYFDSGLHRIFLTQTPICDDQAIDEFSYVAEIGSQFNPVYLSAKRPGETKPVMLLWKYDRETDEVTPL